MEPSLKRLAPRAESSQDEPPSTVESLEVLEFREYYPELPADETPAVEQLAALCYALGRSDKEIAATTGLSGEQLLSLSANKRFQRMVLEALSRLQDANPQAATEFLEKARMEGVLEALVLMRSSDDPRMKLVVAKFLADENHRQQQLSGGARGDGRDVGAELSEIQQQIAKLKDS